MLRPTNAGAATSALFEMKKGTAFSVRQDQQKRRPNLCNSFLRKTPLPVRKNAVQKRALAECICLKRETARFKSGQTL